MTQNKVDVPIESARWETLLTNTSQMSLCSKLKDGCNSDCIWAHSLEELSAVIKFRVAQIVQSKSKLKLCDQILTGSCKQAQKCLSAHNNEEYVEVKKAFLRRENSLYNEKITFEKLVRNRTKIDQIIMNIENSAKANTNRKSIIFNYDIGSEKGLQFSEDTLSKMQEIHHLSLYYGMGKLEKEEILALCETVGKALNLKELWIVLSEAEILDSGTHPLFLALGQLKEIRKLILQLRSNNIGKRGAVNISDGIEKMDKMNKLYLNIEKNHIEYEGAFSICQSLSTLKQLITLHLIMDKNNLQYESVKAVAFYLSKIQTLTEIKLELFLNPCCTKQRQVDELVGCLSNIVKKRKKILLKAKAFVQVRIKNKAFKRYLPKQAINDLLSFFF